EYAKRGEGWAGSDRGDPRVLQSEPALGSRRANRGESEPKALRLLNRGQVSLGSRVARVRRRWPPSRAEPHRLDISSLLSEHSTPRTESTSNDRVSPPPLAAECRAGAARGCDAATAGAGARGREELCPRAPSGAPSNLCA